MPAQILPVVGQDEAPIWVAPQQADVWFDNDGSTRVRVRNLAGGTFTGRVIQRQPSSHGLFHPTLLEFTLVGPSEVVLEDILPSKYNDLDTGRAELEFDTDPSVDLRVAVQRGRAR